jgi:hypothetical protein
MADLDPSFIVGPTKLGRLFGRSRWWARDRLLDWEDEQRRGGPVRVFRHGRRLFTTMAVVDCELPSRRDQRIERRFASLEKDVDEAFRRLAECERAIGAKR